MGDFDETIVRSEKIINPKVSAVFVFLLVAFVYLFFALNAAEAEAATVDVVVNGLSTPHTTTQQTVGELVDSLYPDASQVVSVSPARDVELTPRLQIAVQVRPEPLNVTTATNLKTATTPAPPAVVAKPKPQIAAAPAKVEPKSPTYSGTATWYRFGTGMNAASTQFPQGTKLRVIADNSKKYVDVVINDYGPAPDTGVTLDLNKPAFAKLAPLGAGKIFISYYVI